MKIPSLILSALVSAGCKENNKHPIPRYIIIERFLIDYYRV